MKKYLTAFQMTQSMFCSLPFSCRNWDEKCRPFMLLFLPVVGLEIGVLWIGVNYLLNLLKVPSLIYGLIMCALPYLLTGFMHLDGFMDVVDAIGSWRPLEKRREILKDSHVGSFAVVWSIFLILAEYTMFASFSGNTARGVLIFVPVISRCCSAIAIIHLKTMSTSQYSNGTFYPKGHKIVLFTILLACVIVGICLYGKDGFALLGCLAGYGIAITKSYQCLEGMNGDISGFCICIGELCAVTVLAVV